MKRSHGNVLIIALLTAANPIASACDRAASSGGRDHSSGSSAADRELDRLLLGARAAETPEGALEAYRRLADTADSVGDPLPAITARLGMASAFLRQDNVDSAQLALHDADRRAAHAGHVYNRILALEGLAAVYQRRGVLDSALIVIDEAARLAESYPDDRRLLQRVQERRRFLLQEGR